MCTADSSNKQTLTFLVEALLLIENNELAVLMGLFQDILTLLDVAVVVFQAKEGRHQCHIGLNGITKHQCTLKSNNLVFQRKTLKSNSNSTISLLNGR